MTLGHQQSPSFSQFCNIKSLIKTEVITNQIIYFPSQNLLLRVELFVYLLFSPLKMS